MISSNGVGKTLIKHGSSPQGECIPHIYGESIGLFKCKVNFKLHGI